jgi:4-diphosphocytidyl-2-C-methyl-D-erythritol kinase
MKLTVPAPAKINLTLEVLSKRSDGYHEIRSVIQTIDLYDRLIIDAGNGDLLRSDMPGWDKNKSLVRKALELFREATGCVKGVSVTVEKHIPMMAGLGGDSSDAAAVLKGLDRYCETSLPEEELHRMAEKLGSDVSFFLYGGTALLEGRGETVKSLPPVPEMWVVLAVPSIVTLQGKTGQLFSKLTPSHYTDGEITQRFIETIKSGGEVPPLFNTFENVAYEQFHGLDVFREHFLKLGAESVHLAGSGPVLFTVMKDKSMAEDLYIQLDKQRMNPVLSRIVSGIEKVI